MREPSFSLLKQRLRLRQLRVAVAIAEHGSVMKASQHLRLTQPATTRSLLDLEQYLNVKLFDRLARGVTPTRAGETVLARARRILAEVDRIPVDLMLLETGMVESLTIGVLPSASSGLMPQVLARFNEDHVDMIVKFVEGRTHELLPLLGSGKIDVIVGRLYETGTPDEFVRDRFYDEPLAILARHGHPIFSRERHPAAAALRRYSFILPTLEQRVGQDIEMAMRGNNLIPDKPVLRASSISMIREVLLTSDRISILSALATVGDLMRGDLRIVPLPVRTGPRPGGFVYGRGGSTAGVRALRQITFDYVNELIAAGYVRALPAAARGEYSRNRAIEAVKR
jgi:LysR family pca operon transcriptional activator